MTKIIEQRQEQLTQILDAFNNLQPEHQKKAINLVISILESASLLEALMPHQPLRNQLDIFKNNYEKNLNADISQLGKSDLSQDSVDTLRQIKEIEFLDLTLPQKRESINTLLSEKNKNLSEFRQKLVQETDHKYQHAHARVSWNYGNFINSILQNLNTEKKEQSNLLLSEILLHENEELFFEKLVELNKLCDIPSNFDLLKRNFGLDGIEEHTAINQGTLYRANLDNSDMLHNIENFNSNQNLFTKAQDFFTQTSEKKSIKIDTKKFKEELQKDNSLDQSFQAIKENVGDVTIGFEVEFLLLPKKGPNAVANQLANQTEIERLNKGLADIDSRAKMRTNYGFPSDDIAYTPNLLLFYNNEELAEIAGQNSQVNHEKREEVKNFLNSRINEENREIFEAAIKNIDLLTAEEIFCMDLFFVKNEEAIKNRYVLDDVFDWRNSSVDKNLNNIISDIAYKGSFYKKTLDMIRAHEFSIGEFPIETATQDLEISLAHMREIASQHGLRAKDRDVQMNIGVAKEDNSLLKINVETTENGDKLVTIPGSTADIGKALQNALARMMDDYPWTQRKGQNINGVSVNVDRKKVLLKDLKDTPYFTKYDETKHTPNSSAFPVHRDNTGKSGPVRLACINEDLAVYELRLIGNNTHVPYYDEAIREVFNGVELIPEIFIPYLIQELDKTIEQEKSPQKVSVEYDGTVAIIPTIKLKRAEENSLPCPPSTIQGLSSKPILQTKAKEYSHT